MTTSSSTTRRLCNRYVRNGIRRSPVRGERLIRFHQSNKQSSRRNHMNENEPINRTPNGPPPFRKGDELVVTTESAAFNGLCVAHVEGMALFVAGCVPGDTVK